MVMEGRKVVGFYLSRQIPKKNGGENQRDDTWHELVAERSLIDYPVVVYF